MKRVDNSLLKGGPEWVRYKLRIVVVIVLIGTLAACAWYSCQAFVRGATYPYQSFLFLNSVVYSDFTDVLKSTRQPDPYSIWSLYLPFTYVAFLPLLRLSPVVARWGFFVVAAGGMSGFLFATLRRFSRSSLLAAGACATALVSYPVLICWNRGNIELGIFLLCLGFFVCVRKRKNGLAVAFLVPAMCFKLYPILCLALWMRRGRWRYVLVSVVLLVGITALSFASFHPEPVPTGAGRPSGAIFAEASPGAVVHSWRTARLEADHWQLQLAKFQKDYLVGNGGMAGTSTFWNASKIVCLLGAATKAALTQSPNPSPAQMKLLLGHALGVYGAASGFVVLGMVAFVVLVERDFWRRACLLTIAMAYSAPIGQDYKLVHLIGATLFLAVVWRRRPNDLNALILLTLALVPDRYWFFPFIRTDSGAHDCPLSIVITPCLVAGATWMMLRDGWTCRSWRTAQRRWRMMWPNRRSLVVGPKAARMGAATKPIVEDAKV